MRFLNRRKVLQHAGAMPLLLTACGRDTNKSFDKPLATNDDAERISVIFDALYQSVEEAIAVDACAGASIGVGSLDGASSSKSAAFGLKSVSTGETVTGDTLFRIASVTKTFTAVGVMKLVEDGRLSLDARLSEFFSDFPDGDNVSIYHLLSHTSGLRDWWETGLPEGAAGDFVLQPAPHRVLERIDNPYHFTPGAHHWYSNTGYILLGEICEVLSSKTYNDYIREAVISPAGLSSTYLAPPPELAPRLALGHHQDKSQSPPFKPGFEMGSPGAAGGIWSTAHDLLQWSRAIWTGDVISTETLSTMSEPAKLDDGRYVYQSTWKPDWMEEAPQPAPFMKNAGWGLGFSRFETDAGPVIWHSGGFPGFNAIWLNFTKQNLAVSMIANSDNGVVPAFNLIVPQIVADGARPR
jgi:CubicO group peptidase (beta-lactamase class C family)